MVSKDKIIRKISVIFLIIFILVVYKTHTHTRTHILKMLFSASCGPPGFCKRCIILALLESLGSRFDGSQHPPPSFKSLGRKELLYSQKKKQDNEWGEAVFRSPPASTHWMVTRPHAHAHAHAHAHE